MAKLQLTDSQRSQIAHAGSALTNPEAFTCRVFAELSHCAELGEGTIYRACRRVQKTLWRPPPGPSEAHRPQQLRKLR